MKSAPQRPIFVSVNIKQKYMKLILRLGLILFTGFISISTASAQLYGTADTNAPELRVPTSVKPAFDYWMRDTWATLGPDGYYYITGTTSTPDRYFPGQRHCWDWNDGLYLWRSKDMKSWEARGQIWSIFSYGPSGFPVLLRKIKEPLPPADSFMQATINQFFALLI